MSDVIGQSPDLFYALEFAENKGQWGDSFQYRVELGYGAYFLHPDGFTVLKHDTSDYARVLKTLHKFGASDDPATESNSLPKGNALTLRSHAYRVRFLGANRNASAVPENPIQENINYFLGDDPSRWKSGLSSYSRVTYHDVYPNIDVTYKSEAGYLKYDIIVNPGADLSQIRLIYEGADKLTIEKGRLIIKTSTGQNRELDPYTYQIVGGMKRQVSCKYVVKGSEVRFELKGYDPSQPLVIDPTLVFGTYTGSRSSNFGYTATPGPDQSFFAGGIVFGTGYPTTTGAIQSNYGGGVDIGITRFSPNGNLRIYSTYIGGNSDDIPHSLVADANGNLVILGRTNSKNYPRRGYSSPNTGNSDIVVTKLNPNGTTLLGSAIIGGSGDDGANIDASVSAKFTNSTSLVYNYGDNSRSEVILDQSGNVYIAANTQSKDFPLVNAFQSSLGGGQDAVVCKLDPNLNSLLFSSYLGGSGDDGGFCIKLKPKTNEIYVAGPTLSKDFPGNKSGTVGTSPGQYVDGYLAVIPNSGGSLTKSTYLATPEIDFIYGLQFDTTGHPYVMGISLGSWPVINAAYSNPGAKQFISKLKLDLSGFEYSTVYGTTNSLPNISPVAFLVDRCENVYVSGWGGILLTCDATPGGFDFRTSGTFGLPVTSDAIKRNSDNSDFYIIVLKKNAESLLYGTFVGQSGGYGEHVDGGTSRFDERGAIYQAVCANCGGNGACPRPISAPFPITPGVVGPRNGALGTGSNGECNLGAIKIKFNFDGVEAGLGVTIDGVANKKTGCFPLKVDFEDTLGRGQEYEWLFNDGTPLRLTKTPNISHVFTNPGTYRVRLVSIDRRECVPTDTSYQTIIVGTERVTPDFSFSKLPPCASFSLRFTNESVAPASTPFGSSSFIWDFGDGTPKRTTGFAPIDHTFPAEGVYNVKLSIEDPAYCNAPISITKPVRIARNVKADFSMAPDPDCTPLTYDFTNLSFNGKTFTWDFGDGTTFTGFTPPRHTYATTGTYVVKLSVTDPNTCNVTSDTTKVLVVVPGTPPVASFTYSPVPSLENTPTQFINNSSNAIRYKWDFGDGVRSTQTNPQHQYVSSAINNVCLIALNTLGCADTVCQKVESIVVQYYDVPNAFTPNGDGKNDKVGVRGFGIVKMNFRIYNRWGQLVFQSTDLSQGWDGYYQGRLQPMDVYGYTLDVEMYSGEKYTKKGDITLLR